MGLSATPAFAEVLPTPTATTSAPVPLAAVTTPSVLPTDQTPVNTNALRTSPFGRETQFKILEALPSRFWFNSVVDVSQRLDTNVLFTYDRPKSNYAFRALPNITAGYNFWKLTSVYCNYFVIKDVFARYGNQLNFPTIQSVSLGLRQEIPLGRRTNVVADFQARELWQTATIRQADLMPSINITRVVSPSTILFGGTLLQLRGQDYFQGAQREIDPFYTVGAIWRRGSWTMLLSDTLVNNFRRSNAIPNKSNSAMIADLDISRPIIRSIPQVAMYVRVEPVWDFLGHKQPGLSGFDFRLYGGVRMTLNKPSYGSSIDRLRREIKLAESIKPSKPKTTSSNSSTISNSTPAQTAGSSAAAPPTDGLRPAIATTNPVFTR